MKDKIIIIQGQSNAININHERNIILEENTFYRNDRKYFNNLRKLIKHIKKLYFIIACCLIFSCNDNSKIIKIQLGQSKYNEYDTRHFI